MIRGALLAVVALLGCEVSRHPPAPLRRAWRNDAPVAYTRGNFRVRLSRPRIAYQSLTTNTHFAGLNRFPNGTICLRVNTAVDAVGSDGGVHVISRDAGQTFDASTAYIVQGSHTSAEPLTLVGNQFVGGTFAPADFNFPGGDRTKARCHRAVLSNDGLSYVRTPNGVTFNGFPRNIGDYDIYPGLSWFGSIVQLSANDWRSTILPTYQGDTRCSCECFSSTDQGVTWSYIGSLPPGPNEGVDEATMIRLPDARLMLVSRIGVNKIVRSFSSDNGVTWGALANLSPWCLAPFLFALSGSPDYVITTGHVTAATLWPDGPDVDGAVPNGYSPAETGLYLSSDPAALTWQPFDLIRHHNSLMPPSLRISEAYPAAAPSNSGYTSCVEIEPNHLLISYDRDGFVGGNQVFVVDAWIERVA